MNAKRLNYYQAALQVMKAMFGLEEAASKSVLPHALRGLVRIRASHHCIDMHTIGAKEVETLRHLGS